MKALWTFQQLYQNKNKVSYQITNKIKIKILRVMTGHWKRKIHYKQKRRYWLKTTWKKWNQTKALKWLRMQHLKLSPHWMRNMPKLKKILILTMTAKRARKATPKIVQTKKMSLTYQTAIIHLVFQNYPQPRVTQTITTKSFCHHL